MNTFIQLGLILLVVLGVSFIMRILRQPLIIGYILSGILAGPVVFNFLASSETVYAFSEIGIAFLLFIVGLHLSPKVVKEVGKVAFVAGILQIVLTAVAGYGIAILCGLSHITSFYIGVALSFSSTIIAMKLISDKDALEKLYGKLSIGLLLVQDIVAILILIIVPSISGGFTFGDFFLSTMFKGILLILILIPISFWILPKFAGAFAKSSEFLFLFAITWGIGLAGLFQYFNFSIEVGALIAGVFLSVSPYSLEIISKLKPLRDFFMIPFFLVLGSQMIFSELSNYVVPIIIFSLFVLIGKPIILMILMGVFGYSKRTGFMTGIGLAQISEFSLILIALGGQMMQLSTGILSFVTLIGLITIAGSTYLMIFSDKIYASLSKYLSIFERKKVKENRFGEKEFEYILLGENRIGFSIMKAFLKKGGDYVIVDFNPQRVKKLCKKGIHCIYGDVSNVDLIDMLKVGKAKLVVSTIPEKEVNLMLVRKIKEKNKNTVVIVTARQISETFELYEAGADYVILPHFLGGEYTAKLIEEAGVDKRIYRREKQKQIQDLKERLNEGQEHPKVERR